MYSTHCLDPSISIINQSDTEKGSDTERDSNNMGRHSADQQQDDSSLKQHNINCIIDEGSISNREDCKTLWKASECEHKDCTLFIIVPRHRYHESEHAVERLENEEEDTDDGNNPDSALLLHTDTNKVTDRKQNLNTTNTSMDNDADRDERDIIIDDALNNAIFAFNNLHIKPTTDSNAPSIDKSGSNNSQTSEDELSISDNRKILENSVKSEFGKFLFMGSPENIKEERDNSVCWKSKQKIKINHNEGTDKVINTPGVNVNIVCMLSDHNNNANDNNCYRERNSKDPLQSYCLPSVHLIREKGSECHSEWQLLSESTKQLPTAFSFRDWSSDDDTPNVHTFELIYAWGDYKHPYDTYSMHILMLYTLFDKSIRIVLQMTNLIPMMWYSKNRD